VPGIVPSYLAKLSRAEKHLVELKEAIDAYTAAKPYAVRKRIEGKKKKVIHELVFTIDPANTDIPIIAADVIYNLRSALDHLMACLVANKERSSTMFPVFFHGVWDEPVEGENAQRAKERARWASETKSLSAPALAIIKGLQAPENAGDETEDDRLQIINRLSNRDRHEKLPIAAAGLSDFTMSLKTPDGKTYKGIAEPDLASDFAHDKARLKIPEDAVDVEIEGTPLVVIRVGQEQRRPRRERYVELPSFLDEAVPFLRQRAVKPLSAYVKR
jgi:hypothetical protein